MVCVPSNVTIDCHDPYRLASFWSEVTGQPLHADDKPGDDVCMVAPARPEAPGLLFIRVPEAKTLKNRVHLDLMPVDGTREQEVERLVGLGASVINDRREPDGGGWAVLADPEGNEFCVERSEAERHARRRQAR